LWRHLPTELYETFSAMKSKSSPLTVKIGRRVCAKYFVWFEIVINYNHVAQKFALHPASIARLQDDAFDF